MEISSATCSFFVLAHNFMKKTLLLAALALVIASVAAPANAADKKKKAKKVKPMKVEVPEMKDGGDSLAYVFGTWQSNGLKE